MADLELAEAIKNASHRSFRNLWQAARHLQDKPHDDFSTRKVANASLHYARKIACEAGMTFAEIEQWAGSRKR